MNNKQDEEGRGTGRAELLVMGGFCVVMVSIYGWFVWRADRRLRLLSTEYMETVTAVPPEETTAEAAENEAIARARQAHP